MKGARSMFEELRAEVTKKFEDWFALTIPGRTPDIGELSVEDLTMGVQVLYGNADEDEFGKWKSGVFAEEKPDANVNTRTLYRKFLSELFAAHGGKKENRE